MGKNMFKEILIFSSAGGEHVPALTEGKPTVTNSTGHIKSMFSS